jgi:ubiquinone/menaquinone biosynthesis C-methylase UbiE
MKNTEQWKPSKFVYVAGKLKASRNPQEVNISSRFVADLTATFYDTNIKTHVTGKLLDLGCGKVPLYHAYKDSVTGVVCVDWSGSLHKNQYLDYEMDLNQKLNFADNSFDTVILSDVLEHIRKPDFLMSEIFRVLSPKGKLLMNVPFYYWLHEEPYDYYRYTKFALKSIAEDAGFSIIKLEATGGAPEILTDIISKLTVKIPLVGRITANIIQQLTKLFLNFNFGKKISKKTALKFPFGYVMILEKPV